MARIILQPAIISITWIKGKMCLANVIQWHSTVPGPAVLAPTAAITWLKNVATDCSLAIGGRPPTYTLRACLVACNEISLSLMPSPRRKSQWCTNKEKKLTLTWWWRKVPGCPQQRETLMEKHQAWDCPCQGFDLKKGNGVKQGKWSTTYNRGTYMHALSTNSPPYSTIQGNGQEPESNFFGHSSY